MVWVRGGHLGVVGRNRKEENFSISWTRFLTYLAPILVELVSLFNMPNLNLSKYLRPLAYLEHLICVPSLQTREWSFLSEIYWSWLNLSSLLLCLCVNALWPVKAMDCDVLNWTHYFVSTGRNVVVYEWLFTVFAGLGSTSAKRWASFWPKIDRTARADSSSGFSPEPCNWNFEHQSYNSN